MKYAFLNALELSGSTSVQTGWLPRHLIARREGRLLFAMPLYLKTHSYGEYVFDWSWAEAYANNGLEYYPKLLNAVPFTPATGPRFSFTDTLSEVERHAIFSEAEKHLVKYCTEIKASGWHSLFPNADALEYLRHSDSHERVGCQFHWFNNNYHDFDDFLSNFSSRKRKNLRKERAKVSAYTIEMHSGESVDRATWALFYQLYHRTYLKRSGRPGYLSESFFTNIAAAMPENIVLACVYEGESVLENMMAGALYFKDDAQLYGRYWGCSRDVDGLHFETCYYRGIEFAIAEGLQRFDPGAQGEHKIQRGFEPVITNSFHHLTHPAFNQAVAEFCQSEQPHIHQYLEQTRELLPFKEGFSLQADLCLQTKDHN